MATQTSVVRWGRIYEPERLPAPLGRGPGGWPLKACGTCGRGIPWWSYRDGSGRHQRRLATPGMYYARVYCGRACQSGRSGPSATIGVTDMLQAARAASRPFRAVFARPLPSFDEVRICPHCRGSQLTEVGVGKSCLDCGQLTFVRDGAWDREAARVDPEDEGREAPLVSLMRTPARGAP